MDNDISIVLPTYNRPAILRECLKSVIEQTFRNWEMIVIDDCSPLPVESSVRDILDSDNRIRFVRNLRRRTTPASKNLGVSFARHDLILFLEDDMVLDRDALQILVDTYLGLKNDPLLGAVAPSIPRVQYGDLADLASVKDRLMKERPLPGAKPHRMSPWTGEISIDFTPKYRDIQEVQDIHACVLYPKNILTGVNGFSENRYKGNFSREESDLSYRLHKAGYRYYFNPRAIFFHVRVEEGGSRVSYPAFLYYTIRNHSLFLYYNLGLVKALYMAPLFLIWSLKGGLQRLLKFALRPLTRRKSP